MNLFQPDRCLLLAPVRLHVDGEPALTSEDVSLLNLLPRRANIWKKRLHEHLGVVIQAERPVVIFD